MIGPVGGGVRALRTVLLTLVTLGLAAAAHRVGGGELPAAWVVLGIGAALLGPTAALTARRLTAPTLVVWLGLLEWGLHHALAALTMPVTSAAGAATSASGHVHAGASLTPVTGAAAGASSSMLGAHAVATVVTALALAYAERALWAIWDALRPVLIVAAPVRVAVAGPLAVRIVVRPVAPAWAGPTGSRAPPMR